MNDDQFIQQSKSRQIQNNILIPTVIEKTSGVFSPAKKNPHVAKITGMLKNLKKVLVKK